LNKKNYFNNTESDDNQDIKDEDDAERECTSDDDSNFEEEDVEYEADVGSLEYNQTMWRLMTKLWTMKNWHHTWALDQSELWPIHLFHPYPPHRPGYAHHPSLI
jgi:hypothetical protein